MDGPGFVPRVSHAPLDLFSSPLSPVSITPTGAWCSLTRAFDYRRIAEEAFQCTYRCVVLPDRAAAELYRHRLASQCTYRCVVLSDRRVGSTHASLLGVSQCTYRCVVLPDGNMFYINGQAILSQCTYRCVVLPDPCPRERRYDATSRARSATGPGSAPPDRPAPGPE